MKTLFYALMVALLFVMVILYVEKHRSHTPSNTASKKVFIDEQNYQPADYSDYKKITIIVLSSFLIILFLGGGGYLAIKIYRLDKKTKAANQTREAQALSVLPRKTADEIQDMLLGSKERVDKLLKDAEAKFNKKLQEMDRLVRQAEEAEKLAKESRDIAELMSECKRHYENTEYLKAIEFCEKVIAIDPKYKYAYLNKGLALSKLGRHEEALAAYDEAIRSDPVFAQAYSNREKALAELGRHEETMAAGDEAIALEKNSRYEEALAAYDEAMRLDPRFAQAYYKAGRIRRVKFDPKLAKAYNNKGIVLDELGRQEEALAAYDEAIRLDPNYAAAYFNRARVYSSMNEKDKMLASLKDAVRLDPANKKNATEDKGFERYRDNQDFKAVVGG